MNDNRMKQLLEEIRDLLQRQLANSDQAIANQTAAIEKQKHAIDFYRTVVRRLVFASVPLVVLLLFLVFWLFRLPNFP